MRDGKDYVIKCQGISSGYSPLVQDPIRGEHGESTIRLRNFVCDISILDPCIAICEKLNGRNIKVAYGLCSIVECTPPSLRAILTKQDWLQVG